LNNFDVMIFFEDKSNFEDKAFLKKKQRVMNLEN
jgi:hypothetical protein